MHYSNFIQGMDPFFFLQYCSLHLQFIQLKIYLSIGLQPALSFVLWMLSKSKVYALLFSFYWLLSVYMQSSYITVKWQNKMQNIIPNIKSKPQIWHDFRYDKIVNLYGKCSVLNWNLRARLKILSCFKANWSCFTA